MLCIRSCVCERERVRERERELERLIDWRKYGKRFESTPFFEWVANQCSVYEKTFS